MTDAAPRSDVPLLILVTGAYASGKTTLARKIGERLGIPVVSRDDVYGGLMATLGFPDQEPGGTSSREGVTAFYSTLRNYLDVGVSVIGEQGFALGSPSRICCRSWRRRVSGCFARRSRASYPC